MTEQRLIDTNLIVRYLVQDDPKHAKLAQRLFEACDTGNVKLQILSAVLAESVFVLESFYKLPRPAIASALSKLITSPGIVIADVAVHTDALMRYAGTAVHFVDCMVAASAAKTDTAVASFDRDFKKFSDVTIKLD